MDRPSTKPPSGFRDFTPEEAALRAQITEKIGRAYRSFGFQQILTPACENLSTLQGKGGGSDNEKLIFRILRRGDDLNRALEKSRSENEAPDLADMGLRFDLTLPLARYFSEMRGNLPLPFKVFQLGPVWRADRPQKGRFREFVQCDVDMVGAEAPGAEIDCLAAIHSVFREAGVEGVEFHINDRRLLLAIGEKFGFQPQEWASALVTLDKLDKLGADGVLAELKLNFPQISALETVLKLLTHSGRDVSAFSEYHPEAIASIEEICNSLKAIGAKAIFNASLVRGQDYYTGTIFEARHATLPGSLAGGGRYDGLLSVFGGPPTPAFGGSIGFERLLMILAENSTTKVKRAPHVYLPLLDAKLRSKVLEVATELRTRGLAVDVYPFAAKLKNQFKYADSRGCSFTLIIGEDELNKGVAVVKDMRTSEQTEHPLSLIAEKMEALCRDQ
jgi:histidyl-tRNA synthetase